MRNRQRSILLLGESNVGKTHYGAQVLKRLIVGRSSLKMHGQATNLSPFEDAMDTLADGRAIGHTPSAVYVESVWPVIDEHGNGADLIWPDYGGEQVRKLIADHSLAPAWRERVLAATDWILLLRLHILTADADIFSRPLHSLGKATEMVGERRPSDQARLIELLQMLLHVSPATNDEPLRTPGLTILLSCWDEVEADATPKQALRAGHPMLCDFVESRWESPVVMGLSALGRSLSESQGDASFATCGPESFGFVIRPEGISDPDITWPITRLVTGS